ncbi:hypothetical protein ACH5RR_025244 [Cinchona calisaya]|uniref:SAM domain-containing protein n=1 Tax=Cinchona calisaya TaxID=153742 RepID=A0ABD2Z291_9GENT
MADLNPLDGQTNGGGGGSGSGGGGIGETKMVGTTAKRQRRPSVRLGDIGGDPPVVYEHHRRGGTSKQLQMQYQWPQQQKGSRGRSNETLMVDKSEDGGVEGFVNDGEDNEGDLDLDLDLDRVAIGSWKTFRDSSKSKRGRGGSIRKRVRSNWVSSKIDASEKLLTSGGEGEEEREEGFNLDNDEGIDRNFERENLEDDEEEEEEEEVGRNESPIRSFDNNNEDRVFKLGEKNRRRMTRVSDEMECPSDSVERNGVKIWLNQLGLGRYAPVFEIHEVDDEVLPMLTLEDLKDMGINAVGTRRKMYCSIQKLNKGFS